MKTEADFLAGKSEQTIGLYHHFIKEYSKLGKITIEPTKSMIGIASGRKKIAWVTHFGKNFIHVVFPFNRSYNDNLCFQKIAQVPGSDQFNHHFRMLEKEDINKEVMGFMKLALVS